MYLKLTRVICEQSEFKHVTNFERGVIMNLLVRENQRIHSCSAKVEGQILLAKVSHTLHVCIRFKSGLTKSTKIMGC